MARATTWSEFREKANSEKRVIVLLQAKERAVPANVKLFYFSNIEREEITGLPQIIHKGVKSVPQLRYSTNEVGGDPPAPAWSNLVLQREDGYDISPDGSGIYFDDLGNDWIIENDGVVVWFGGDDLPFSEYQIIFSGVMGNAAHADMTVTIPVRGNENRAYRDTIGNTTITAATWPNAPTANIGKTVPVCIGFVTHMKPICVDASVPNALRYIFHDNSIPYLSIGVYDQGVALTAGVQYNDNADGTFTLAAYTPLGDITCFCVQGVSNWATVITGLLQTYAGFVPGDIDAAAVAAADIALPYAVTYLVQQEMPVMDVVSKLSVGIPAYYGFQRDGIFRMEEITDPTLKTPDFTINSEISNLSPVAILDNSLSVVPTGEVFDTVNMSYYENHSPIPRANLAAILTETQRAVFETEWRMDTYFDAAISTTYQSPAKKNMLMRVYTSTSTQSAAVKWVNLFKISRTITKIKVKCQDLSYNIGDIVSITFNTELKDGTVWYRHNYNDKRLMIVGIQENYDRFETVLTLWG